MSEEHGSTDLATAAVLVEPGRVELQSFQKPEITDSDAILAIEACGVCGSDIGPFGGTSNQIRAGVEYRLPLILGHEIVGRIERIGDVARRRWGVEAGDRVILERWLPCGHCDDCRTGDYRLCVPTVDGHSLFYGGTGTKVTPGLWGGFASHLYLHPSSVVYPFPESIPAHHAPLFTPLSNAISWLRAAGEITLGSRVVIIGPGQEGLVAVMAAAAFGASQVIVVGLEQDAARLRVAQKIGATASIQLGMDDPVERVRQLTAGRMADIVLDVTSAKDMAPVELAVALAGKRGRVILAAAHGDTQMKLNVQDVMSRLLTIRGVVGRERDAVFTAIQMLASGKLPLGELDTKVFSLQETGAALDYVRRGGGESFHAVVQP